MKYSINIIAFFMFSLFVSNLKAQPTVLSGFYSFYEEAVKATWVSTTHGTSEKHYLKFGKDHKRLGSARLVLDRKMEDGRVYSVLHTHPKWTSHGVIRGYFPWINQFPQRVLLTGSIGFIKPSGSPKSDGAKFFIYVKYKDNSPKGYTNVKVFECYKRYNGKMQDIEVDLSRFAGKKVSIELRVDTGKKPTEDWAAWHALAMFSRSR